MEHDSSFGHPKIYFLITSKQSWHSREWRSYGRSTSVPSTNFTAEPSLNLAEALGQVRRPPCPQVCQSLFLLLDRITKWPLDQIFTPIFLPTWQKEHEGTLLWTGTGNQNCAFKWISSFQSQWSKVPTQSVVLFIHQPHSWDSVMQKVSRFFHWLTPRCPNVPCPEVWNSKRLGGPGHICPEDNAAVSSVLPLEVSLWHKDLPPTPDFSNFLISRIIYRISFRSMVYSLPVW